ncbi:MAG: SDR family NAD(P)-dependent oxidoreductase [Terriglobia bacterium]
MYLRLEDNPSPRPSVAAATEGVIVNVSSGETTRAAVRMANYGAAKAAMIGLMNVLAQEGAKNNIRVNTLSPGGTETERMLRFGSMEKAREVLGAKHLMKRLAQPEEIAAGAVFLASDASSFMTGADLRIDGGYNAI